MAGLDYNCMNTSLGMFHVLFWRFIFLTATILTVVVVVNLYDQFQANPTVTTLKNSSAPVTNIPFPGVSVCSLNKISRKRAENLANRLTSLTGINHTVIMDYIRFIGQLYDFDFQATTVDDLLAFQKILNAADLKLINLVKNLAVPCEELLAKCFWRSMKINCSKIFEMRLTNDGYCCVFNYVKKTSELSKWNTSKMPFTTEAGIDRGLRVVINNNLDDYFYSTLSSTGVIMQIFVSSDFPDKPSGNVRDILIQTNSENFIEIKPRSLRAVQDVRDYPVHKRDCLHKNERTGTFNENYYSQSDCIVGCRIESALALCQCVPFNIPISNDSTVCTLEDIPCLHRYRDKWFTMTPDMSVEEHLMREIHDSLRCSKTCYPTCNGITYEVQINNFPIINKSLVYRNRITAYIYYGRRFFELYDKDVVFYWFEILGYFGGMFGVLVGLSLISAMEALVFVVQKMVAYARSNIFN